MNTRYAITGFDGPDVDGFATYAAACCFMLLFVLEGHSGLSVIEVSR